MQYWACFWEWRIRPATVYLLKHGRSVDTAAGLAEPGYTGYARKAITFGAAAAGRVTQSATVTFDQCTAGSATVTHWALFDASTAGNMLAHGALAASKSIVAGNTPSVASGQVYGNHGRVWAVGRSQRVKSHVPQSSLDAAVFVVRCSYNGGRHQHRHGVNNHRAER